MFLDFILASINGMHHIALLPAEIGELTGQWQALANAAASWSLRVPSALTRRRIICCDCLLTECF